MFNAPARALFDDFAKLITRDFQKTVAADACRHALEKKIDDFFQTRLHVVDGEVGDDQPHAAIDIESNATGRDYAALVHVHRRDTANWKPVAAMAVRHAERVAGDAWECGDVADLLVNGFVHFAHQLFRSDDSRRHAHAIFVSHR